MEGLDGGKRVPGEPVKGIPRQRFTVELNPNETTVVDWKKLLRSAQKEGEPSFVGEVRGLPEKQREMVSHAPPRSRLNAVIEKIEGMYKGCESSDEDDQTHQPTDAAAERYDTDDSFIDDAELDDYFSVDKTQTKYHGFFVHRGKLEPLAVERSVSVIPSPKKRSLKKKEPESQAQLVSMPFHGGISGTQNLAVLGNTDEDDDAEDENMNESDSSEDCNDDFPESSESTDLEKVFANLKKVVFELCPPVSEHSLKGKRRQFLPHEVKVELRNVVGLSLKQGDDHISQEVTQRLMGILGHRIQRRTLQKNLRKMFTELKAERKEDNRLEYVKSQISEMLHRRIVPLQSQGCTLDGPEGEKIKVNEMFKWDIEIEDQLCHLYEEYVMGLREQKGPRLREFFTDLSKLWPQGSMSINGVKKAIYRAKKRRQQSKKIHNDVVESRPAHKRPRYEAI